MLKRCSYVSNSCLDFSYWFFPRNEGIWPIQIAHLKDVYPHGWWHLEGIPRPNFFQIQYIGRFQWNKPIAWQITYHNSPRLKTGKVPAPELHVFYLGGYFKFLIKTIIVPGKAILYPPVRSGQWSTLVRSSRWNSKLWFLRNTLFFLKMIIGLASNVITWVHILFRDISCFLL